MNFALTEDQIMIRDAAGSFLGDVSGSAALRAAMQSEAGHDAAVWQRIGRELGWCGVPIAEEHGGLGLGAVEMVLILEQMGRHLLCAPFFSTICLAANLLNESANAVARKRFLPEIALGELRASVALPSAANDWNSTATDMRAQRIGDGWLLHGNIPRLPDARVADWIFVFAQIDGSDRPALFALPRGTAGLQLTALKTWDATRRFASLQFDGVSLPQSARIDDELRAIDGYARSAALARLYVAAEQLGGAQACLDMTVAYTATRKQFGRSIASFQAVKHRCAEMMVQLEGLRSAVRGVALLAASNPSTSELVIECAMTRALAGDVYFFCAQEAIQLHGGVGFTWEYDPQLHFKRAQASGQWFGCSDGLCEIVAERAFTPAPLPEGEGKSNKGTEGFRAEVAQWMQQHLSSRFATLKHRGGPGDEEFEPSLRKDWERELAAGGWTCVGWPREHGGRGLAIEQQVIFHEEYARAGGPGRMGHIGEGLIGPALIEFGSADQQRRFLPGILAGRDFWAQGYSEPGAGSDLANVQTKCERQSDGSWRVTGQKIWTSLAHESDWIFVLARSEPGSKGNKGLAFLLLALQQPGITIRPIRQLSGGSEFNEVFFDGAIAQADDLVGAPGEGWKVAMGLLEVERGVSTLGQQMHFAHELELVIDAARANGESADPQIRGRIAQAWSGLRVLRYNALRMLASGTELILGREALVYKYAWSNWHRDLGKLAMDVLGADGDVISDDPRIRPLQQLFFFSRADTIYGGTNEIQLNLIAERGLGMPREARVVT